MTTRFRVLGGLCVSLLAAVCVFRVSAQTPPVGAFRAAANAVVLDVSVTDDRNRPMLGLTARDFTITEDGKERPVVAFDAVNVTSQSSTPASWPAADVVTNEDPLDGRVMAIVMDDATPMPVAEGPRAKDAARALVDRMGPKDLAAVVFPAAQQSTQDFTRDRARLRAAIDRFQPRVDLGSTDRRIGDDRGAPNNFTHFDPTASTLYLRYLKTLRSLVDALGARALGRKSLVLISVGLPIEIRTNTSAFAAAVNEGEDPEFAISAVDSLPDPSEQKDLVFREVMNTIRAAMTSSVRVYGIDPGGARTPLSAAGADEFNAGLGNKVFLEGVSRATGGFAITSTNDVHAAGAQILADTGTYYLLGYQSTKRGAVKVRVNRPGAAVSIRPPVVRDGRPPDLSTALNSLVPLGGLAMQMTAAPFAIPGGAQAALAVVVGFRQDGPATGSQIIETVQVVPEEEPHPVQTGDA